MLRPSWIISRVRSGNSIQQTRNASYFGVNAKSEDAQLLQADENYYAEYNYKKDPGWYCLT